jgi:hypothetical protein
MEKKGWSSRLYLDKTIFRKFRSKRKGRKKKSVGSLKLLE